MTATTVPAPHDTAGDKYSAVRPVRCQGGYPHQCPEDATVAVIDNPRQMYAKRYLCERHYLATRPVEG